MTSSRNCRPTSAPSWRRPDADAALAGRPLRVVRLASVFEAPVSTLVAGGGWDSVGGMQNHTGQLTRELDQLAVQQTVVTARRPSAPRVETLGRRTTVHRVGLLMRSMRQLYCLPATGLLKRVTVDADLIHAHLGEDLALCPLALAAARHARLPLVLTIHMSMRHTLQGNSLRTRALKLLGGALEGRGEAGAAAVLVLTPRLRLALAAEGVDLRRIHVIPSGVDPRRFRGYLPDPLPEIQAPRVVFVGRLAAQKDVATLLRAAARMSHPAYVLVVGDGPERARLERQIGAAGLRRQVRILGFQPPEMVAAILRHADVFVLPSCCEELGSALLEAMECGLPIVASRTGGIPAVVGGAGLLVEPGDERGFALALDRILGDARLASNLRRAARDRAAGFHWPDLARQVLDVYRQVATGGPDGMVDPSRSSGTAEGATVSRAGPERAIWSRAAGPW